MVVFCGMKLSCDSLRILEVAFNLCLRHIWSLSLQTHIEILHSCADLQSFYNMIHLHAQKFLNRTSSSSSLLMHAVFHDSPVYTFAGLNLVYGAHYKKCIRMMINIVQMLLFIRF